MKVLFYFGWSFAETGGTQRAVLAIGSGLIAKGHSVTVLNDSLEIATPFYPYDPALEIRHMCEDVRAIEPTDVRKEPARSPSLGTKKKSSSRFLQTLLPAYRRHRWQRRIRHRLPQVKQAIAQESPDVCIVFSPDYASLVASALPDRKFPVILAFRHVPHILFDEAVGIPDNPIARMNFLDNFRYADAYSILIPEFASFLSKHNDKPICYIPNGVRLPELLAHTSEQRQILFASRFATAKRPQWLMEAFARVAAKHPDWSLQMYGSGTDGEEAANLCKSLGVPNQIKLHGAQANLTEAYQNAEIFCIPSHFEGFSNSLAEAMSYQLACVAVDDCISNSALLKDGAGYLTRVEDGAAGLAEALDTLMGNPELRKQLGTAARQKISAFTPERVTDEWDSFLRSVTSDYKQKKRLFARA